MSNHFFNLSNRFGSDLEVLDREQKLLLATTLITYMWRQEQVGFSSSFEEVWEKILAPIKEIVDEPWDGLDEEFQECLNILQGISVEDAGLIARRLLDQCIVGNANKLRHEEFIDALIAKGFPEELAKKAAEINFITCFHRGRTPEESEILMQAMELLDEK